MKQILTLRLGILVLLAVLPIVAQAETVTIDEYTFTANLPDGWTPPGVNISVIDEQAEALKWGEYPSHTVLGLSDLYRNISQAKDVWKASGHGSI